MSDRFEEILMGLLELHQKKSADYGVDVDPYANVRASSEFGVRPWVGAMVRLNDKIQRIKSMIENGHLVNESIFDSFDDICVYSIIARILYEQELEADKLQPDCSCDVCTCERGGFFPDETDDCCEPEADEDFCERCSARCSYEECYCADECFAVEASSERENLKKSLFAIVGDLTIPELNELMDVSIEAYNTAQLSRAGKL